MDSLLVVEPMLGRTPLAWLGVGPTSSSPAAVKAELEKLAFLRRLDAHTLDLSMLPAERRRFLAGVGRRLTAQVLQRREPQRRYPILLTLLAQSAVDVLDETLLRFDQAISGRESAAKQKLTELYATGARKVPAGAPVGFVPTKWAGYLAAAEQAGDSTAYWHYWELCVLVALRDGLRSGDVFVPGSRRYADPASFLLTMESWAAQRAEFCHLVGKPPTAAEALAMADDELQAALGDLEGLLVKGATGEVRLTAAGELVIPPLTAEDVPAEAEALRTELAAMLPRVPLASVLVEVDARTGFSAAQGQRRARYGSHECRCR